MNVFRKIHDRLTGVLGRDCQGKPLRKGDRVVAVVNVRPGYQGVESVVVGAYKPSDELERTSAGHGPWVCLEKSHVCRTSSLKRIDSGDDVGWEKVTDITGWTPRTVTQTDEVPA